MTKPLAMRLWRAQRHVERVRASPRIQGWDRRRLELVEAILADARAFVAEKGRKR